MYRSIKALYKMILMTSLMLMSIACEMQSDEQKDVEAEDKVQQTVMHENEVSQEIKLDESQYLELEGVKLHYKTSGDRSKEALILLHGFTFSLETWDRMIATMPNEYYFIRLDFPGHGRTGVDSMGRYSSQDRVQQVKSLIDHLELDQVSVAGNSMGGNVAWRFAALYPDKVNKLVLIDASGFPLNGLSDVPLEINPAMKAYLTMAPKASVTYAVSSMYADPTKIPSTRIEQIVDMMQKEGNGKAFVKIFETFTLPDPTAMLNSIRAPTLILWGAKDVTVPPEHADLFKQAIPNSEVFIFENVGHVPQEEEPQLTANKIIEFINKSD